MTERVDKSWHSKGIETYSSEAIFGTLGHYGVTVDEAGFRALAKNDYPLAIAHGWHQTWKGTGQFSRFPAAAAEELWRRLLGPELAPTDIALGVVKLLTSLNDALDGKPDDGTWNTRFAVVEGYLPKIPREDGKRQKFLGELTAALGKWDEVFDSVATALALKKQPELAKRFAAIEEGLYEERQGTSQALVQAALGEKDQAVATLTTLANDQKRNDFARLSAVDALLDLEQFEVAKAALLTLLEKAEQTKNLELASHAVEMLTAMLKLKPDMKDRAELRAKVEALAKQFAPAAE